MAGRQALVKRLRDFMLTADSYDAEPDASARGTVLDLRLRAARDAVDEGLHQLGSKQWYKELYGKTAPSRIFWLAACADAGWAAWLLRRLQAIPALATASPSSSAQTLLASCEDLRFAFLKWTLPIKTMVLDGSQDWGRYGGLLAPMLDEALLTAVANAARSTAAYARHTGRLAEQAALGGSSADQEEQRAQCAARACEAVSAIASHCMSVAGQVLPALVIAATKGSGNNARQLAAPISQLTAALRDSQLPAAAAAAMLTYPGPNFHPTLGTGWGSGGGPSTHTQRPQKPFAVTYDLGEAICLLGSKALEGLLAMKHAGSAASAAGALDAALSHPDVGTLRLAMLEAVWAHAGMEPLSEQSDEGSYGGSDSGQGGSGGQDVQEGRWRRRLDWLRHERSTKNRVCEADGTSAGQLEGHHLTVVVAALGPWRRAKQIGASAPASLCLPCPSGVPPEVHMARLTARTAEALCRMSRGQGLSSYLPRPLWSFSQVNFSTLLMPGEPGDSADAEAAALPVGALPPWAEAAAWSLALHTQALAAEADGRCGNSVSSAQFDQRARSYPGCW
ncbi:hypothetical protein HYH03_003903 [Edaphochlamys debaryana]|uniref:Uncharacterized protein n=1 Tax=Edaphochlamys debaryana TaxID=47281 RepID=A0A836C2U8_9CHLO|nr:hypothetical protein HYH03_003903 [Edaphochlamys debaryana]|eukprot:KAG2498145.1 hypothetical protein HYH03_003903 [Edaphochlamys debaryana]